jgi:hypothetical protein
VNNETDRCERKCTDVHELVHIHDWIKRYGVGSCANKAKGYVPIGGSGYSEFLRQSECRAYRKGKACRKRLLQSCPCNESQPLKDGLQRDIQQLALHNCGP